MASPPPFYPVATDVRERNAISEVIPGKLYVSNWRGASDTALLKQLGVTHIAAVGDEFLEDEMEGVTYWKKDITDSPEEGREMAHSLRDGASFVHGANSEGGCTLVHCAAGASRSATVALAYLILHGDRSLRDAFTHLWQVRPATWPNDGFMAALIELETSLKGKSTVTPEEYESWGDYEPPEDMLEETSSLGEPSPLRESSQMRPALPRLQRQETTLALEKAASKRADEEDRLALLKQVSSQSCYSDADTVDLSSLNLSSLSQSQECLNQHSRGSLTKAQRQSQAMEAANEARLSRRPVSHREDSGRASLDSDAGGSRSLASQLVDPAAVAGGCSVDGIILK